ncbi:hypothetical protein ETU09_03290 [Apibacter muscae]|uniref:Phage integrase SAM-like domain-containing protein n=1 Tax=Apibacter muscae TaxID=2509004 RepID=A0A563DGJ2_9FLAO|nr:site-specific integrase [Apibacter muscae]TWP29257.1 hypothetical protein ETU09_03290 [Apibacter muscae]
MASLKYLIQSKNNPATIYLRLSIDRGSNFKKKIPLVVNPKNWSIKKGKALEKDISEKNLNSELSKLETFIIEKLNISQKNNEVINSLWLENKIDVYFGDRNNSNEGTDFSVLTNYLDYYIAEKEKEYEKGLITLGTLKKVKTVKNNILEFQKYSKRSFRISDINKEFISNIEYYSKNILNHSPNTIGRFIKFIKAIVHHAQNNQGITISNDINLIKGYSLKTPKTYLSFEEIEKIEQTTFTQDYLDNARDWLIIGCFTGQRVSDLLNFTSSDLIQIQGKDLIQIKQQKTQKLVSIPIHPKVRSILEKRNGEFPRKISDQKFNLFIKEVCNLSGIDSLTKGLRMNPETKRREEGIYPKWELVTSHICRRSFATNFYGKIPTSLIIGITAHSTEKQYLEYVGKPEQDKSLQVAELWENEEKEKLKKIVKLKLVSNE